MPSDPADAARVRVFPPGVPLITILVGQLLERLWPIAPTLELGPIVRYGIGGAIVVIPLFALGVSALRTMRNSGQDANPLTPTTSLIETGPYRFTRNAMYRQRMIACLGIAVLLQNP